MEFKWERIDDGKSFGWTERARVYNGWLVRTLATSNVKQDKEGKTDVNTIALSITFVPDFYSKWVVQNETKKETLNG